jgi:tetratricopeptide (TPR) repeat protein
LRMTRLRLLFLVLFCGIFSHSRAQQIVWPSPEVERLYQQAQASLAAGGARQAVPLLKQVAELAPNVPAARRDLAQAYILLGQYDKAHEALDPLFDLGTADESAYRLAASAYDAQKEGKKSKAILRRGLQKYPGSGLLYKELGTAYENEADIETALSTWLEGIEKAPSYHVNYYEAAHAYVYSRKLIWCILYAEIFVNLERQTPRANESRKMLLAAYKRFFFPTAADEAAAKEDKGNRDKEPSTFEEAVIATLRKNLPVVSDGVTTENLTMLRTRFILDWKREWAQKYPFALFQHHDAMLRASHFDAYNQFLFGRVENAQAHDAWTKFHPAAMSAYESWAGANPLKPGDGGFYNDKKVKGIFLARKAR